MEQAYTGSPIQELYRFRNAINGPEDIVIPEKPENRRVTDKTYTITFIVIALILVCFIGYTFIKADLRTLMGYDSCGNFCGYKNEKYDEWSCTGKDYTNEKYLKIIDRTYNTPEERFCLAHCPPPSAEYSCADNTVDPDDDIIAGWWVVLLSLIICCGLCLGTILLFKYAVATLVWSLLIGGLSVLAIAALACWITYFKENGDPYYENTAHGYLSLAILLTFFVIIMGLFLTCFIKRVKLIIQLFEEAAKAVFEIPGLIYLPIMTFVAATISVVIFLTLITYMSAARTLVEVSSSMPIELAYEINGAMIFAIILNCFVFIWIWVFMTGAQYMIIAGAIASWFFTRNKSNLGRPLWISFMVFVKFHLGTVFIGSLIIAVVMCIKAILKAMTNRKTRWIINCCCNPLIEFLKLFSKNSYIQTAMHGQPFFKSGRRALQLLVSNAENVIAINSIGDFVLAMAQILLIIVGTAIACLIAKATGNEQWAIIGSLCFCLITYMVISFFGIFEATIDSIFMCFCEDSLLNDGMARPYFMSKELRKIIEKSKGLVPDKKN
ncbi:choline transporter-like protein 1 [Harmonia axyridis]|uniref:choline transporter-like protein 1 n=1 Tax=Harmonia axyridis TaxID=115357 RepID=UPI001E2798A8|nr:choline transporter-like protein 1 [Harmonia axyridis]XP_045462812.1 choline transporter-like protein 1 [Harmonia axyridis]XP_045462813.1 choline transporter-like protein 1 [Harmonia axyridis]